MPRNAVVLFDDPEGSELLKRYCEQVGLELADLEELLERVIGMDWMQRRRGLFPAFDEILDRMRDVESNKNVSSPDRT